MLKSLFHIWLSMILMLNSMVFSVIQMDYAMNKEYITANFCINKDKPEMHCDGKCFLMEKMNEAKEQQEQPTSIDFSKDFGLYILEKNNVAFIKQPVSQCTVITFYHPRKVLQPESDIFHPPKCRG